VTRLRLRGVHADASGERGSAAVLAAVLVGTLLVATVLGTAVAAAVVGQRRVETAADLGALAGASALERGASACVAAADVVRRNGGVQVGCDVAGAVVTVRATRSVPSVLGRSLTVSSTARAGPTSASGAGPRIQPEVGRPGDVHG
jgi:secretion/DNA translocation related TadE-like protein